MRDRWKRDSGLWCLSTFGKEQHVTCNLVNNGLCNLCCLKAEQCCLQHLANRTNYQQQRRREKEEETKKCPNSDFRETFISSTGEIRSLVELRLADVLIKTGIPMTVEKEEGSQPITPLWPPSDKFSPPIMADGMISKSSRTGAGQTISFRRDRACQSTCQPISA